MRREVCTLHLLSASRARNSDKTHLVDFKRGGFEMSHHHFAPRKTVPPRASSRDPTPEHARYDDSSDLVKKQDTVDVAAVSPSLKSESSDLL